MEEVPATFSQAVLGLPNGRIKLAQLRVIVRQEKLGSVEEFLTTLFEENDVSLEAITPELANYILKIINDKIKEYEDEVPQTSDDRKRIGGTFADSRESKKQKTTSFPLSAKYLDAAKITQNAEIV